MCGDKYNDMTVGRNVSQTLCSISIPFLDILIRPKIKRQIHHEDLAIILMVVFGHQLLDNCKVSSVLVGRKVKVGKDSGGGFDSGICGRFKRSLHLEEMFEHRHTISGETLYKIKYILVSIKT